jgi:photoactive yellow protein
MEIFRYETVDVGSIVNRIPEKSRNDLPFGLIKLDRSGKILEYNMAQASIAGIDPREAIGKNFFLDLAVCTQRPEFFGKFKEGVDKGQLNALFEFTFDMNMKPTRVRVHMVLAREYVFLMVKKLGPASETSSVAQAPPAAIPEGGFPARADTRVVPIDLSPLLELREVQSAVVQAKTGKGRVEDIVLF